MATTANSYVNDEATLAVDRKQDTPATVAMLRALEMGEVLECAYPYRRSRGWWLEPSHTRVIAQVVQGLRKRGLIERDDQEEVWRLKR